MSLSGAGFGAAQALTAEQERKLREFQVKQNAEIARGELARRVTEDANQQQTQMRTLNLAELKRTDDVNREATQRNAASDMAGVMAMPGMSNQDKANEIMGSGLRTGSVDPMKVIEGLTRIQPSQKPGTHVVGGNLVDDSGKVLFQAPEKPAASGGREPTVRVIRDGQQAIIPESQFTPGRDKLFDSVEARQQAKTQTVHPQLMKYSENLIRKIDDLVGRDDDPATTDVNEKKPNRITNWTAGGGGMIMRNIPFANTEAKNVDAELFSLTSELAIAALQKMRASSQTGGAVGNVALGEMEIMKNAEAAIRSDQSPRNLIKQLGIIRNSEQNFLDAVKSDQQANQDELATSAGLPPRGGDAASAAQALIDKARAARKK